MAADRVFGNVEHTFCEIDPFCQEVLRKHWPQAEIYGDIRTVTADTQSPRCGTQHGDGKGNELCVQKGQAPCCNKLTVVDLLTGGFPCQPFSQAGRRKGTEDDRYLWPEMLRVIREFHPRWIIGENVGGLVTWNEGMVLEQVHLDLEGEGYEVQSFVVPAVAVNAPHRRDRVWIVGHAKHDGFDGAEDRKGDNQGSDGNKEGTHELRKLKGADSLRQDAPHSEGEQAKPAEQGGLHPEFARESWDRDWAEVAARLCRVDDGVPRRLDRNPRLKALGNAIVPQVAEEIMKAIKNIRT